MSSLTGSRVGVIVGDGVNEGVRLGALVAVLDGTVVALGRGVAVVVEVDVGRGVGVADAANSTAAVLVGTGVAVSEGVDVGFVVAVYVAVGVREGGTRGLAVGVRLAVGVLEAVDVGAVVGVLLGRGLGVTVGGLPSSTNRPEAFQSVPTNIWTSYSPGCHSGAGLVQLATATPAGKSFQDVVSTYLRAPFWYHRPIHSTFTPSGWYVKTEYICLIGLRNFSPGATRV
jgi:hypothetical protein